MELKDKLIMLLLMPVTFIINGFVLRQLWEWFIVPTFDLPLFSIPIAIGIGAFISYTTHQYSDVEVDWNCWSYCCIAKPLTYLLVGYIVTLFA